MSGNHHIFTLKPLTMSRSTPIHYQLADMIIDLAAKGALRATNNELMDGGKYSQTTSGNTFMLDQEIVIMDTSITESLSVGAMKLIFRIMSELRRNNPLWYCEKPTSQIRSALKELREKDIIRVIGSNLNYYIVNPEKIRRGKPLATLVAFYRYCKAQREHDSHWILSDEAIRDMLSPRDAIVITPKLLK